MGPRLVLSAERIDGERRWICLDAKFRAGRRVLAEAFASAHLYRDALRWPSHGGSCRGCLLLVPNASRDCESWFDPTFIARHGFGAAVWAPGRTSDVVMRWLTDALAG